MNDAPPPFTEEQEARIRAIVAAAFDAEARVKAIAAAKARVEFNEIMLQREERELTRDLGGSNPEIRDQRAAALARSRQLLDDLLAADA